MSQLKETYYHQNDGAINLINNKRHGHAFKAGPIKTPCIL